MRPSPSDDPVMNTRATAAPPLVATIRPTIPNGFPAPRARPLRSVLGILTNDIYSCIHGEPRAVVCDVSVVTAEEDLPCEIAVAQ
jgi:hypothetical protein